MDMNWLFDYIIPKNAPEWRASLAMLASAAFIVFAWWWGNRQFRLHRSMDYIKWFHDPEMVKIRNEVDQWLAKHEPAWELIEKAAAGEESENGDKPSSKTHSNIRTLVNFFQILGVAFENKAVHEKFTWGVFGGLAQQYWRGLWPYMYQVRRNRKRDTLFEDFENLAKKMKYLDPYYSEKKIFERAPFRTRQYTYSKNWLFGYGSLISPESFARTAGENFGHDEVYMAELKGYKRSWTVFDWVIFKGKTTSQAAVFLNIEKDENHSCNGILIPVTEEMLKEFDKRERQYKRIDVTKEIRTANDAVPRPLCHILTYIADPEAKKMIPGDAVVPQDYQDRVNKAAEFWGKAFKEIFDATTKEHDHETQEGTYEFADPPEPIPSR